MGIGVCVCVCGHRGSLCVWVGLKTSVCTLVHAELGISLGANVAPICCMATVCTSHGLPMGQSSVWKHVKFISLCSSTYLDLVLSSCHFVSAVQSSGMHVKRCGISSSKNVLQHYLLYVCSNIKCSVY